MSARSVVPGFSPLDEALALGTSHLSPRVLNWVVQLGASLPFGQAAPLLANMTGVHLSEATVRRQTEAVGATISRLHDEQVARLEQTLPEAEEVPERLVISADGAMVPLVGGAWAEVKLLAIGIPVPTSATETQTHHLTYFARLADAETFGRQAFVEVQRRGVERATHIAAVMDGAEWLQALVERYRPDAVRILDWPHAVQRLSQIADLLFGEATVTAHRWFAKQRYRLLTRSADALLARLARWQRRCPAISEHVAYLAKRAASLQYPQFRQQGWPIGSGMTERANKWFTQARLKRPGMHWQRTHVNALLAIRTVLCNDRWDQEGVALLAQHQHQCLHARRQRQQHRRLAMRFVPSPQHVPPPPRPPRSPRSAGSRVSSPTHPWRRYPSPLPRPKL